MQGAGHLSHCGSKRGSGAGGILTLQWPEEYGQEAAAEYNNSGVVDLRRNLEASGSEGGTRADTHVKPASAQDGDGTITSSTDSGQKMQGEESGGYIESLVSNYQLR